MSAPRKAWVIGILSALGADRFQVAYNLGTMGFKGERGHSLRCPIKHYLEMFYPNNLLGVGDSMIGGCDDGFIVFDDEPSLHGVRDFNRFFDAGEYPGLDSNAEYKYKVYGRKQTGEVELIANTNVKASAQQMQRTALGYISTWQVEHE